MSTHKKIYYLALFTTFFAFIVIILGAYTRLTGAGLGCPDWPGCYGMLTVPNSAEEINQANKSYPDSPVEVVKGWIEMNHRYFASTLGIFIFILAALIATKLKTINRPLKLAISICILTIIQGLFGMLTVTLKLLPIVVTAHLIGGLAVLSLLWLLTLKLKNSMQPNITKTFQTPTLRKIGMLGLTIVSIQIFLGGWTSTHYAALACLDFPTCHGAWWPEMDFQEGFNALQPVGPDYTGGVLDAPARTAIHYTHRVGALITTLVLLLLTFLLFRNKENFPKILGLILLMGLSLQVTLGILNVTEKLPLALALAHNAGAALLLLIVVTINFYLFKRQH